MNAQPQKQETASQSLKPSSVCRRQCQVSSKSASTMLRTHKDLTDTCPGHGQKPFPQRPTPMRKSSRLIPERQRLPPRHLLNPHLPFQRYERSHDRINISLRNTRRQRIADPHIHPMHIFLLGDITSHSPSIDIHKHLYSPRRIPYIHLPPLLRRPEIDRHHLFRVDMRYALITVEGGFIRGSEGIDKSVHNIINGAGIGDDIRVAPF